MINNNPKMKSDNSKHSFHINSEEELKSYTTMQVRYSHPYASAVDIEKQKNFKCTPKPFSKEEAIEEIKRCSGIQFDPEIVEVFVNQVLPYNSDWGGENLTRFAIEKKE